MGDGSAHSLPSAVGPAHRRSHQASIAEYVWLGGQGSDLRSQTVVLECVGKPAGPDALPVVTVDGSCCNQAPAEDCEVFLQPRRMFHDPFRDLEQDVLVLCDTYIPRKVSTDQFHDKLQPHPTNNRVPCETVMAEASSSDPVFEVEQEFTLLEPSSSWPIGWPSKCFPEASKPYYGGVGTGVAVGRQLCESHIQKCLEGGIKLSGLCAMNLPGQWSYTIGSVRGIDLADQLWMSRYILLRVSEEFGFMVSFDPKPIPGDWSGTGCHIHFSTWETRVPVSGLSAIQVQMQRLQLSHLQHMMACGQGNMKRLLSNQSKHVMNFSCEVGNKAASVMIPRSSVAKGCGHYVDRRAGSNMDPYLVTMFLVAAATGVGLPVLPQLCSSDAASQSWCRSGLTSSSNNSGFPPWERSEDLLIDALEKLEDSPDTPPNYSSKPLSQRIIVDDECSDGTSPEREGPLSCAARNDVFFV